MASKNFTNTKDKKGDSFINLFSEKLAFKNLIYSSVALNIINLLTVIILQKFLPPQVPLFYGLVEGEEQLTSSIGLIIPAGLSISLLLTNCAISLLLENRFLQKTLTTTSFTVSLLSAITVAKIVFLVGSI